jgi:hypothetical protein
MSPLFEVNERLLSWKLPGINAPFSIISPSVQDSSPCGQLYPASVSRQIDMSPGLYVMYYSSESFVIPPAVQECKG